MQVHGNTTQVVIELTMILFGLPVLGLITSAILWAKAKHEPNADRRQYQRLGFGAVCFAFAVPVLVLGLNAVPIRYQTLGTVSWLPLLSLVGVVASLAAAIVLAINARGPQRVAGPLLCLLGLAYCGFTILAFLAGGAGL